MKESFVLNTVPGDFFYFKGEKYIRVDSCKDVRMSGMNCVNVRTGKPAHLLPTRRIKLLETTPKWEDDIETDN